MRDLFVRHADNPILVPSGTWWEDKGVLNPGVIVWGKRVLMVYRAVGRDGISRFGMSQSDDGVRFDRSEHPWWEARLDDPEARLGIEDPRITLLDGTHYLAYTKAAVHDASSPFPPWEPAPFRVRSWLARTDTFASVDEVAPVWPQTDAKDLVLFPGRVRGRYVALIREYPSIQLITSPDLRSWSAPVTLLEPRAGTWEGERVGAGPPPILTERGWLVLYHANEYLELSSNRRLYRMGLALLDSEDPAKVVYRHPDPVMEPEFDYERNGPVGNVVFGTGLLDDGDGYRLYYGAGDGVIGLATAERNRLLGLLPA